MSVPDAELAYPGMDEDIPDAEVWADTGEPEEEVVEEKPKRTRKPKAEPEPEVYDQPDFTLYVPPGVTDEQLALLKRPTPTPEIRQRAALRKNGQPVLINGEPLMLDYVDARYVMDTLDELVGPANWQTEFNDPTHMSEAIRCRIGILTKSMGWVWKGDAGVASTIEPEKGAHSDAFKRAAVHWGIARDLYEKEGDVAVDETPIRQKVGASAPARQERYEQPAAVAVVASQDGKPDPYADMFERTELDPDLAPWVCPVHGRVQFIPAGKNRTTGKPYGRFLGCPLPKDECGRTAPFGTI